jgi:hypothetical protein
MKVLVYVAMHSEYGKVMKCDFKPGSAERSIDLEKQGGVYHHYKCSRFVLVA